jgi:hypothetical protein
MPGPSRPWRVSCLFERQLCVPENQQFGMESMGSSAAWRVSSHSENGLVGCRPCPAPRNSRPALRSHCWLGRLEGRWRGTAYRSSAHEPDGDVASRTVIPQELGWRLRGTPSRWRPCARCGNVRPTVANATRDWCVVANQVEDPPDDDCRHQGKSREIGIDPAFRPWSPMTVLMLYEIMLML